jgi:phosphoglycerol transferase MdoB-like AlkP superfamily enzyme
MRSWRAVDAAFVLTLTIIIAASLNFFIGEGQAFRDALFAGHTLSTHHERRLTTLLLISKTAFFALPFSLLLHLAFARTSVRLAFWSGLLACSFTIFLVNIDLRIYAVFGRHLTDLIVFAQLPEGHIAGGNPKVWMQAIALEVLRATAVTVLSTGISLILAFGFSHQRIRRWYPAIIILTLLLALGAAPLIGGRGAGWSSDGLRFRVLKTLPWSFGLERFSIASEPHSPMAKLRRLLSQTYRNHFAYLLRRRAAMGTRQVSLKSTPNVYVILVESLREDVLTPQYMPRLSRWAKDALVRKRHFAGTNFSESGTFTMLYGINPLAYHAILDSEVPATMIDELASAGYETSYFTGHPTVWNRREEFLGPDHVDNYKRFVRGDWSDWDRDALAAMKERGVEYSKNPQLLITFMMSTHYEYRYPKNFERFTPADEPEVNWIFNAAGLDFKPLRNRYYNAVGYLDEVIGHFVETIHTTHNFVIITGDHAEALGERDRIGHGFDFSDHITHVPFIMKGPGIEQAELVSPSLHSDIWPTLRAALQGGKATVGDLREETSRSSMLQSHCSSNEKKAAALLVHEKFRAFVVLSLKSPELRLVHFEDKTGEPINTPELTEEVISGLNQAFVEQLAQASRPLERFR